MWAMTASSTPYATGITICAVAALILSPTAYSTRVLAILSAAPILTMWIVSQGPYSFFLPRYFFFLSPLVSLLAASGLISLSRIASYGRFVAAAIAVTILFASERDIAWVRSFGSHENYYYPGASFVAGKIGGFYDFSSVANYIAESQSSADALVFSGRGFEMLDVGVAYYGKGRLHVDDVLAADPAYAQDSAFVREVPDEGAALNKACRQRVWYVTAGHLTSMEDPIPPAAGVAPSAGKIEALTTQYRVLSARQFAGITVMLMGRITNCSNQ